MKNGIATGETVDFANGGTPAPSGSVVVIGKRIGVAAVDIAANDTGAASVDGVYALPKLAGGGTGWAQGVPLFWDSVAGAVTATPSANASVNAGQAFTAAADADITAQVDIEAVPNRAAAQADSVAANVAALVVDFNALLAKLRAAGIMSI